MHVRPLLVACLLVVSWVAEVRADPAISVQQMMADFGVQLPKQRKAAPLFSLPKLGGGQVALADARGKLVLLHFWATWCGPCRHEMPLLHSMEQVLGSGNFRMICVNVDRGDSGAVQDYLDKTVPQFHTLLDRQGMVRNRYAVRGLPTTYLIDGDGKILGRIIGERDWQSDEAKRMMQGILHQERKR